MRRQKKRPLPALPPYPLVTAHHLRKDVYKRQFLPQDADDLLQQLASGKIMVALMSKGHFTQKGHFILLRGATLDGQVLVADPNSPERSLMAWDPQIILDELSASRDSGAPLWLLSPAS